MCEDAAFKILNPKAVPKFFRLNSHNAILEFLLEVVFLFIFFPPKHTVHIYFDSTQPEENCHLIPLNPSVSVPPPQGTPEIKEHYIDSKKDVDRHLKFSCEQFIQQQTQIFVGNLEEFLTKVRVEAADLAPPGNSSL